MERIGLKLSEIHGKSLFYTQSASRSIVTHGAHGNSIAKKSKLRLALGKLAQHSHDALHAKTTVIIKL